jgi:hypothetical protein
MKNKSQNPVKEKDMPMKPPKDMPMKKKDMPKGEVAGKKGKKCKV